MTIAVIGCGLIGAAAARHLALMGHAPTLIGPLEPADKRGHKGVFASHYDEGRITRRNATDPFWSEAASAAIDRYAEIEAASGIRFHTEAGGLMMGHEGSGYLARVRNTAKACSVECEELTAKALSETFPFLDPQGMSALWERTGAGHISPRRLVAAQTVAAVKLGATHLPHAVTGLVDGPNGVRVHLDTGENLAFDHVLVAAGGFTDHVLARPVTYKVFARTVALLEVDMAEAQRLAAMPSMVVGDDVGHYILPPIRYPDGKTYLKIGGDPEDTVLETQNDMGEWFRSGGNPVVRDHLEGTLRGLLPQLTVQSVTMDACVTTFTDDDRPEIRSLSPRLAVAAAGCGQGAKCSDELGRRAAALVLQDLERTAA